MVLFLCVVKTLDKTISYRLKTVSHSTPETTPPFSILSPQHDISPMKNT